MNYSLRLRHRYLIAIVILLAACTRADMLPPSIVTPQVIHLPRPTLTETHIPENQTSQEPTPTKLCTPATETPDAIKHDHIHLDINLDYAQNKLLVTQCIDYTNNTSATLSELPLIVPPAHHPGAFALESLETGPHINLTGIEKQDGKIWLFFQPPLSTEQSIQFSLTYRLKIPAGNKAFGYTDRQILLADWYPFIPPYIANQGWHINPPGAVGEHLVYPLSDFTVNLCLTPPELDLIIAASAPLSRQQGNCYAYHTEAKRNFSLAISPYYHVSTAKNKLVTVKVYTFPEHTGMGDRTANLALKSWNTFTDLFGNNQRQFMSIVEADIFDGLEADGLFYLSDWYFSSADKTPKNYYELLVVHETAHQWFYGFVHNDQANEPWLDEALATYSELLFYERHHPKLVNWWWDFRVHSFNPAGAVNSTIYDFNEYRPYINSVYLRGALFLQALRNHIGDEAFFAFIFNYVQTGEEDFLRDSAYFYDLLQEATDEDLSHIWSDYFR